jgi:hypothetical protein
LNERGGAKVPRGRPTGIFVPSDCFSSFNNLIKIA